MDPTYTIFHKDDETFSVLWTAYQPDLRAFCQDWEADRTRYGDIHTFEARPPEAGQGLFNISAVPWASFRSLHLELPEANDYLLPIFTFGRAQREGDRIRMPASVQAHHAAMDGFHVCRVLDELEALLETAGGICEAKVLQNRHTPDPHSFIGEGKAQEVRTLLESTGATLVVFDNDLSPSQIRALEELYARHECPVISNNSAHRSTLTYP